MIRVALISHLSEISGAGLALVRLARGLDPARFAAEIVLPGRGPLLGVAREQGVPVVVIENPEFSMASAGASAKLVLARRRLRYVRQLVRHFRSGPTDVVYINTTITVFAGIAARLAGKPIVWHVRELLENPSWVTRCKMWLIEHLADAIFYASHASQRLFPAPRVPRHLVVRNVVEIDRFSHPIIPETLDRELGIRPGELVVTTNGVFPRKAPDVFLQAAGLAVQRCERPLRFVLVGPALPDQLVYYEQMQELARQLGIAECVTFAGLRTDMPAILARSDIFVSPSRNEAQPNVINEALAAGTPVIATDVGDCRLMLRDGEFGALIPRDDPEALANAILETVRHLDVARQKAARARQALAEEFSSKDFWKPVETILEELARKSKK